MKHSRKIGISAMIQARNEEDMIPGIIENLKGCVDEILLFDGGSTDNTRKIARKMGAKVIMRPKGDTIRTSEYPLNNYIKLAKNNWILGLDADERISDELKAALPQLIADKKCKAYRFPRKNYRAPGVWWKYGGYYPDYCLRLFDRRFIEFQKPIHTEAVVSGEVKNTSLHLLHLKYLRSKARILSQHNEYLDGEPDQIRSPLLIAVLYPLVFSYFFFYKLGVLEIGAWGDLLHRTDYYTRYSYHLRTWLPRQMGKIKAKVK